MKRIGYILWSVSAILALASCEKKDFDYQFPAPSVAFTDGRNTKAGVPNGNVRLRLTVQAASELASLKVRQAVNNAAATDVASVTTFENDFTTDIIYPYVVPATAKPGDVIRVLLEATDKKGVKSTETVFTVNVVGALFVKSEITVNGNAVTQIAPPDGAATATINEDEFTFEAGKKYLLKATTQVEEGLTVNLAAGTEIYASTDGLPANPVIFQVPAGATIKANGTKESPVLLTSDKILKGTAPAPGDWQGLSVLGNAIATPTDNSGTLRYVRIEFGGKEPTGTTGSFLMNNVGSGTVVEYIQAFRSVGQGIRINGGTVRAKYLISTNSVESDIRLDDFSNTPYSGFIQYLILNNNATPRTAEHFELREADPTVANVTILGRNNVSGDEDGLRSRSTAIGYRIFNMIMAQIPDDAVRMELASPGANLESPKVIGHSHFFNIRDAIFRDQAANVFSQPVYNNVLNAPIAGIGGVSFVPDAEVASTYDPKARLNAWFGAATFAGAVRNAAADWTADGTWCKNSDGTIR